MIELEMIVLVGMEGKYLMCFVQVLHSTNRQETTVDVPDCKGNRCQ